MDHDALWRQIRVTTKIALATGMSQMVRNRQPDHLLLQAQQQRPRHVLSCACTRARSGRPGPGGDHMRFATSRGGPGSGTGPASSPGQASLPQDGCPAAPCDGIGQPRARAGSAHSV